MTALEPDAEMLQVLQRTTRGLPVVPVGSTFEQFATARRFDLVLAAAAWHWTDPASRWQRAVGLLVPGGVLALCGCPAELHDPALRAAVDKIEEQVLAEEDLQPCTSARVGFARSPAALGRRQSWQAPTT